MPSRSATIDVLSEQLLGRVLELAGQDKGRTVTLVCKQWRRVFYAEPALWRNFSLKPGSLPNLPTTKHEQWFANKHGLLRRVARLVAAVDINDASFHMRPLGVNTPGGWQLEDFFHFLHPGLLTKVKLVCGPSLSASVARALLRHPQLTSLEFSASRLPANASSIVGSLAQLRTLRCTTNQVEEQLLGSVALLGLLTALEIQSAVAMPSVQQLTALTQLQHLTLVETSGDRGSLQPPAVAAFPRLASYRFHRTHGCFKVADVSISLCQASQMASKHVEVTISGVREMEAMQTLMDALLPSGCHMGLLRMEDSQLELAALQGCTHLAAVRAVQLTRCSSSGGPEAAVQTMLQCAPSMWAFGAHKCCTAAIPGCIVAQSRLTRLEMQCSKLTDLPPGPYLAGLDTLDLSDNRFTHLPPALESATALIYLRLASNPKLVLTLADVETLRQLTSLRRLTLGTTKTPPAVFLHMGRSLPQLVVD